MILLRANQKEPLLKPTNLNKILFQKSGMELRDFGLVIIRSALVRDRFSAQSAPVDDHPALGAPKVHADRFHQSAAGCGTVSRALFIDVLAPETTRTVITAACVFQRLDLGTAMPAGERFLAGNEGHQVLKRKCITSPSCTT